MNRMNSGMSAPIETFRPIKALRFIQKQEPELFHLANQVAQDEVLDTKVVCRQILLTGLRKRVRQIRATEREATA